MVISLLPPDHPTWARSDLLGRLNDNNSKFISTFTFSEISKTL